MSQLRLLWQAAILSQHQVSGRTIHHVDGEVAPPPARIAIGAYEGDAGFYLLYYDQDGNEVTDTFHDSVEAAMDQAEFEFGIGADEWVVVCSASPNAPDYS